MKKTIFVLLLNFCALLVFAQVKGIVLDETGKPLKHINVSWLGDDRIKSTNNLGEFDLDLNPNTNHLVFFAPTIATDTIKVIDVSTPITVILKKVVQLNELSVITKKIGVIKSRTAVIHTEKITAVELCKAACCNLSESFETNPSVDVSYSDAATGAKQIKMLGLSGTYVQMLTENIPNLRGISSSYGLGFIPGPWLESIQVSKGTASVINGYEAIAGQINVEYKKPLSDEKVAVNVFGSDAGRLEMNVNAATNLSKHLSTGILLHVSDELKNLDENADNFMDMPMAKQYNFINRWYFQKDDYVSQAFIRALSENRMGGQLNGNYHIGIDTKRYEFFLKNGIVINHENETSAGLIISGSIHNQDAKYGVKSYNGNQRNLYANLIFQTEFGHLHKLSTGASFNYDKYNENLINVLSTNFLREEYVPGIFAEYTFNLHDKFIALAGLRADYNSAYGSFITPRLHLKYSVSEHLQFRASAGKGYRSPNVLAENNNLLASNRAIVIQPSLKMEEAWNAGISGQSFVHIFEKEVSLNAEWYFTNFTNQVVVDMDSDPNTVSFSNLNGKSYANSIQFEANAEVFRGLTMTIAHRITDAKTTIGGVLREKPLTSRSKSLITASYQSPLKKWQIDFTTQFNGGGRLPDPSANNPLWVAEFKPFTIFNAQITRYFKKWSIYSGVENLTSFVQNNPIIDVQNPFGNNFDASMVWGPMHGRKIYVGLRWAFNEEPNSKN